MKGLIKKIAPAFVFSIYHWLMAYFSALYYWFPSGKLFTIGVTGTTGKSSTCYMLAKIFEEAGYKVGMTSTVFFKIDKQEKLNDKKMTMLGRFQTQKFLHKMIQAGCEIAIIETTSEGIKQFRHKGINYDTVVFTNLYTEHIEAHGGFENYKKAKGKLFQHVQNCRRKKLSMFGNRMVKKTSIINLDDEYAEYFLSFPMDRVYGFTTKSKTEYALLSKRCVIVAADKIQEIIDIDRKPQLKFQVENTDFVIYLFGSYNVYNALAAVSTAISAGIDLIVCKKALEKITGIAGRMEIIDKGQPFFIIVDYAFEPKAISALYEVVNKLKPRKIIHVTGSTGGGRDRARRPILGKIIGRYADIVIVTNEDPYDDDPMEIIEQVADGAREVGKKEEENLFLILDRRQAIRKALSLAKKDDLVLITGKGAEQAMVVKGKLIPWDDRRVVKEEVYNLWINKK